MRPLFKIIWKKDFLFLIKGISIVFLIAGVFGIYEFFIQANPYNDYIISIAGDNPDKILSWIYDTDNSDRGYRVRSIFVHPIGGGMNFGLFFLVVFYLYVFFRKQMDLKYKYLILIATISMFCMFAANSRGPVMFTMIGLFPFFMAKNKYKFQFVLFAILSIFLVHQLKPELFNNLFSIFDTKLQNEYSGSNFNMRIEQLSAALQILSNHPFFGIGIKGLSYYSNQLVVSQLLSLESMWLWIIVEQGIVGIIVTLYLIYTLIVKNGIKAHNQLVVWLSVAYFVTYSMTSVPGFAIYLWYAFVFMFIKLKNFQINE